MFPSPTWLPYDWPSCAIIALGFAVLCIGGFAWSAASLRVALGGDWLAAIALQAGATVLVWSALCGRQLLPMARRPWIETDYWLGFAWEHRSFDIFARDGLVWMAAGLCLLLASLGLGAMGPRPMSEDEEVAP